MPPSVSWRLAVRVGGNPRPQPRPRRDPRRDRFYVPRTADPWLDDVRAAVVEALQVRPVPTPRPEAWAVVLVFVMPATAAHWRRVRRGDRVSAYHVQRPDVDNLVKAVLDGLGAWRGLPPLLWDDDAQIVGKPAWKRWPRDPAEPPGLHLTVLGLS